MLKMQQGKAHKIIQQEVMKMALSNIFGWNKEDEKDEKQAGTDCGTACGASDEQPEEKQTACGTACGASDK